MSIVGNTSPANLTFKVRRSGPELVTPAKPTPHEFKLLSDLDDQDTLRGHIPCIHCYPFNPSMNGVDPAKVIRQAIAETLVYYYPFAGRLREVGHSSKLIVECTGEGVLFVEAEADVTLDQFGYPVVPPFPCSEQLFFDIQNPNDYLNLPLLLFQVTRLKCGGFTFAYNLNHTMCDAPGIVQFLSAVGEIAKGATAPSVLPTWERQVLSSRNPPQLTCPLPEYDKKAADPTNDTTTELSCQSFFFGPTEISTLRRHFNDANPHSYSSFDIITASILKCRTIALQPHPEEEMGLIRVVSFRGKFKDLIIPAGYYGNAAVCSTSTATAKEMIENPLRVVRNVMDKVSEEYVRSLIDFLVTKNRKPRLPFGMNYYVESNLRYIGFEKVDFGWGVALYGGPAWSSPFTGLYVPFKNGVMLPLCLPKQAMERFVREMNNMLKDQVGGDSNVIKSRI